MITYKHHLYITKAIEGVLAQKTNFPVQLIIADDSSPDNTAQIVDEFVSRYPQQIRYIRNESNLGMMKNFVNIFSLAKEKYIALCEGDDYWCDENKLQKQVDFLEANSEYAICFHRVYELFEGKLPILSNSNSSSQEIYTLLDLANGNFIHTPSVVFRNNLFKKFPNWFIESPVGDYPLHLFNARHGLIKYFPQPMSVYRIHGGGVWSTIEKAGRLKKWLIVLDYLLTEDFETEFLKKLQLQKRLNRERYLMSLMKEDDWTIFLKTLSQFANEDNQIAQKWLIEYYPKYINSIKGSKSYRFVSLTCKYFYKIKKIACFH